jgi:hypothetical protein
MYLALSPGAVGIHPATLEDAISAAVAGGFGGLELSPQTIKERGVDVVKGLLAEANLAPAGFGLSIDFRQEVAPTDAQVQEFAEGVELAAAVGLTRCMTWIMPCSNERPFDANFEFHVERLQPLAKILQDNGVGFGLEFVGPKTLRDSQTYPFVYDIPGMTKLAEAVGPEVGFLVDSFHWYCTGSNVEDLAAVPLSKVVYVHINDAQPGKTPEEQVDNQRALPAETGVIDAKAFLGTLKSIGYDGPLVAEPFLDLSYLASDAERAVLIGNAGRKMLSVAFD